MNVEVVACTMKSLTVLWLLFATRCTAFPVGTWTDTDGGDGYFSETGEIHQSRSLAPSTSSDKTGQTQNFFDLDIKGRLDEETIDKMQKPKCGFSDVAEFSFFSVKLVWQNKNLTYKILNYTTTMAKNEVDWAIQKAFKIWSDVTLFTFTRIYDNVSNIEISFVSRDHNDHHPFDGPSGILAHAFAPKNGQLHFDNDEKWTNGSHGENLFNVATHEIGHLLGLYHSNDSNAVMYKFYREVDPNALQLSKDDIDGIQSLYGVKKNPVQPAAPNTTNNCLPNITFDAVTTLSGAILFFQDGHFWRKIPQNAKIDLLSISSFWPPLANGIQAAYEYPKKNRVFLFQETKYWALKGYEMEKNYPKNISELGFPRTVHKVDAAVHDEETEKTYFFVGDKYWSYDEQKSRMGKTDPQNITEGFPGIGNTVQAAFKYNGSLYFFNEDQQYEYNMKKKKVTRLLKTTSWFNC
ncbi:matrix metalloproteinase-18 [Xenopus tropicalis]|uniref:Matrix metalloproteinase-18 n=1 Tax=Xenopus tropicalis TaxID=8364 RepID=A0A6I8SPW3_XENTR|nr:matrix metalloproteinase-18 [Xenopus tropicalis]